METLFSLFVAYIREVAMGVALLGVFGLVCLAVISRGPHDTLD